MAFIRYALQHTKHFLFIPLFVANRKISRSSLIYPDLRAVLKIAFTLHSDGFQDLGQLHRLMRILLVCVCVRVYECVCVLITPRERALHLSGPGPFAQSPRRLDWIITQKMLYVIKCQQMSRKK